MVETMITLQYTQEVQEVQQLKLHLKSTADLHIVRPVKRRLLCDLIAPKFEDLVDLGLLRVVDAAFPGAEHPPRLFATAETVLGRFFTRDDWLEYGNLETEMGRMRYMFSELPERGIPTAFLGLVCAILSSGSVLNAWQEAESQIYEIAECEIKWILSEMRRQQATRHTPQNRKSSCLATPVDYRADSSLKYIAPLLWKRALAEIITQTSKRQFHRVGEFLQIFAFLKDPLGGIPSIGHSAKEIFNYLMDSLANSRLHLSTTQWFAAAAQSAQEAIFLATPLLQDVEYIHFHGHQQLPYAYVELDSLSRSEFSISTHVVRIIEEILDDEGLKKGAGRCRIAPIAVAMYPALPPNQSQMRTIVIDGNHRATATMILRLIAEQSSSARPTRLSNEVLEKFCFEHGLGTKWKLDLADVLAALHGSPCEALILKKMDLVKRFHSVEKIPALVVREDHFHTACQQRSHLKDRPRLLLPIHQAIYNDDLSHLAFPQAGQVHGRACGFRAMPLLV